MPHRSSNNYHSVMFFLLAVSMLTTACGNMSNSTLSDVDKVDSTLIVFSGGFNSCIKNQSGDPSPVGMEAVRNLNQMVSRLEKSGQKHIYTAVSCFVFARQNAQESIYYVTDADPGRLIRGTRKDFYRAISELNQNIGQRTHIAGHSYGGWNIMEMLKQIPMSNIKSVTTIDPISPLHCKPGNFILGGSLANNGDLGCMHAPSDFSQAERSQIASLAGYWQNFYQEDFRPLNSSKIEEAHSNTVLKYRQTRPNAHGRISYDQRVWSTTESRVSTENVHENSNGGSRPDPTDVNDNHTETPAAKIDIKIALSEPKQGNDGEFELFLSTPLTTKTLSLCKGTIVVCKAKDKKDEMLFVGSASKWTDQNLYRLKEHFTPSSNETYTVLARSVTGDLIGIASFKAVTR